MRKTVFQMKNKPNTRFHVCQGGCGEKLWTEVPVTCKTCRAELAALLERLKDKPKAATRSEPAAVARGRGLMRKAG